MNKLFQVLLFACVAVALCSAQAPRRRAARLQAARRNRFLARQEVAEEAVAVTPYPSAKELIPEVPFEEVDAFAGDVPAAAAPAAGPAVGEDELPENQPDLIYGPPEIDVDEPLPAENELPEDVDDAAAPLPEELPATVEEVELPAPAAADTARLIAARRGVAARRIARPAKLRAAPRARPARLQQVAALPQQQQQFAQQPLFYYTAQLQNW